MLSRQRVLMDVYMLLYSFFFFKQKTAYEMRISDWSSDVCSSDLDETDIVERRPRLQQYRFRRAAAWRPAGRRVLLAALAGGGCALQQDRQPQPRVPAQPEGPQRRPHGGPGLTPEARTGMLPRTRFALFDPSFWTSVALLPMAAAFA